MRVATFGARRKGAVYHFLIAFFIYLIGGFPTLIYALPQGGTISSGAGTIDTSGSSLTVNQTTDKIIINWESFSIGNNESVIFLQPDSSSSALNNVLGTSRTVVEGNLAANGQIVLSNPNGIFISPTANVNVASLIASTLKISEQDFIEGLYKFSQDPNKPLASILNEGKIRASDFAALIAPSVDNKGVVIANLGTVGLVSGQAATVDFVGDNLIKFTVNEPVEGQVLDKDGNLISDRISNSGSIQANGGQVILSAKNASSIIKNVISMDGVIEAKTVTEKNGRIFLGGGDQGTVNVAGTLNASGEEPGLEGGEITIEGADVRVAEGSIQAKGTDAKGGNITITGTDWVSAGGTMDVSGETGGNVNITTGGLSLAAPILAKGSTGQGGNININTLFKSWEVVSAMLDVSGASGGSIQHFADQQITTSGKYLAIGTDGIGGNIDVTANALRFLSNTIDASGTMGGGSIRLGGEYQGGKNLAVDEIKNAKFLFLTDAANITAKATGTDGDGGRIIAWADQKAMVLGQFDVRPGTQTGAGGFVEASSGDTLTFRGSAKTGIDDRLGTLLLDPRNITIREDTAVYDENTYMIGEDYEDTNDIDQDVSGFTNQQTVFGISVSLDGQWLAVGAEGNGTNSDVIGFKGGTVFLYSYTDTVFSGGTLQAVIGDGFSGGNNVDFATTEKDFLGSGVSLHGGRLAVGARGDDGYGADGTSNKGAVHLFTFNDDVTLSNEVVDIDLTYRATIGRDYTGTNDIDLGTTYGAGRNVTGNYSLSNDGSDDEGGFTVGTINFGYGVSLSEDANGNARLAVGASGYETAGGGDAGCNNGCGAVALFTFADAVDKDFSNGALAAVIGEGFDNDYSGNANPRSGRDIDMSDALGSRDLFGIDVSLTYDSSLGTHRVAAVAMNDDGGSGGADSDNGAVHLFSFTDDDFSGGAYVATIGANYIPELTVADASDALTAGRIITGGTSGAKGVVVAGAVDGDSDDDSVTYNPLYTLTVASDSNALTVGETITGGTSGATGVVVVGAADTTTVTYTLTSGHFADGETVTGGTSTNTRTISEIPLHYGAFVAGETITEATSSYTRTIASANGSVKQHKSLVISGANKTFSESDLDGNYLALGSYRSKGGGGASEVGEVYIYSFTNNSAATQFSEVILEGIVGKGVSGAQDVIARQASGVGLTAGDKFGGGVALDNNRLVVGAELGGGEGNHDSSREFGEVFIFPISHYEVSDAVFATNSSTDNTIWPSTIIGMLSGGSNVTLQANQDITVTDAILVGSGGAVLTMQAGRSILINANITTDDGALTLTANDTVANGVMDGERDSGDAVITLASGTTVNTGTGSFTATISAGADKTNSASGDITLSSVTAGSLVIVNNGTTAGSDILDTGVLTVTGTSSFTTAASDGVITLDSTNVLSGAVNLNTNSSGSSAHATLDNGTTALIIAQSTVGGNLTLTSGHASGITDSGIVTVKGNLIATTDAGNGLINMVTLAVERTIALTTNGTGDATVVNADGLNFAASTIGGDLTATASDGDVIQQGALTIVGETTITATGNDVTLNLASNDFDSDDLSVGLLTVTGKDVNIQDSDKLKLAPTISGNLTVLAGNDIDDGGLSDVYGITDITSTGGYVKFNDNCSGGVCSDFKDVVNIHAGGGQIILKDANSIKFGTITTTGNFTLTASQATTGTVTQTDTGTITIAGITNITNTGGDVTLTRTTNDFASDGTGAVKITGANVEVVDGVANGGDSIGIDLGASTVSGTYTVTATAGNITDSGTLAITQLATLNTSASNATITLDEAGSTFAAGVSLNTTGSSGNATVDTGTNALIVATSSVGGNLTLTSGNASGITDLDGATVTVNGNLSATTDANNGVINLGDLAVNTDGGSTIAFAPHGSGNVTIVNADGINFAESTMHGVLTTSDTDALISGETIVYAKGGAETGQEGTVVLGAGGSTTVTYIGTQRHTTSGIFMTTGGTPTIEPQTSGAGNTRSITGVARGTLTATATTGSITQSGALSITGDSVFTTSEADEDITLQHTSNNLYGDVAFFTTGSRGDVAAYSSLAFYLDTSTINGNLEVETNNTGKANIGDEGIVTVSGTTDLSAAGTSNTKNAFIYMDDFAHVFRGGISARGHHVLLQLGGDSTDGGTALGTIYAARGKAVITSTSANGSLTQTGPIQVNSDTTIAAGSNDVTLDHASNSFGGNATSGVASTNVASGDEIIIAANDVVVVSNHSFNVGASTIAGDLTLTSVAAESSIGAYGITDTADVSVAGDFSATTTANNGAIIMGTLEVNGTIALATHGTGNGTIVNDNGINFETSTVGGNLNATATDGDIIDTGVLGITGNSTFTAADGHSVYLGSLNTFTGTVTFASGGNLENVTIRDQSALDLTALTLGTGGDLTVTTTGTLSGSGALVIPGTTTITATGQVVDLDHTSNNFATITFGSSAAVSSVEFVDTDDVDIGTSQSSGNFTVTAGGDVDDTSTITVGGDLSVTTSAGNGAITLDGLRVDDTIALTTHGNGAATVVNDVNLKFVTSTVGGALIATATEGSISQGGSTVLTVTGNTSLTTSESGGTITLDQTNRFGLTGSGTLALNTSGSTGHAIIDNGTTKLDMAASSVGGDLTLTSGHADGIVDSGTVTVTGNLTLENDVSGGNITMGTLAVGGWIAITTSGSSSAVTVANDVGLILATSNMGGTFSGEADSGDITQVDDTSLTIGAASTFIIATGSNIALDKSGNTFSAGVTMKVGDGTSGSFGNITFVEGAAVKLDSNADADGDLYLNAGTDLSVGGNLSITAGAGNITQGAAVTVTGTSSFETSASDADIVLSSENAFAQKVTLTTFGAGGDATLDNGTTALIIAASDVRGDLTLESGHASGITDADGETVTVGGNLAATTTANNGDIDMGTLAVTGTIALATHVDGSNDTSHATIVNTRAVKLAASTVDGNLNVTATTGDISQTGALDIEGTTTLLTSAEAATIDLSTTTNAFTGTLLITTNDNTDGLDGEYIAHATIDGGTTALIIGESTIDGDLTLTSGHASGITDSATVTVLGNLALVTDDNNGDIDMGTLAVTGTIALTTDLDGGSDTSHATIINETAVQLVTSIVDGDLAVTAKNGTITQDGNLTISGTADFYSESAGNIILDDPTNDFIGAVRFRGGAVVIKDANDINFGIGNSTAAGTREDPETGNQYALKVTVEDEMDDAANLFVTGGNAWFGTNNASTGRIDLDNGGHTVAGTWTLEGGIGHTVTSASAVVLTAMDLQGNLRVTTTGGTVTDTGTLIVAGLTVISAIDGSGNDFDVTLDGDGTTYNNFRSEVQITGANVVLKDTDTLKLGASTVSETYTVTASAGDIKDYGTLAITGLATFTTSTSGADIELDETGSSFAAGVSLNTTGDLGDAAVDTGNALAVAASSVGGDLTLESAHASGITDLVGATVTVGQNLAATATANSGDINLGDLAVDGTIALTAHNASGNAGDATIVNTKAVKLANSTVDGNLSVTAAAGNITDTGVLTVTGTSSFTTSATDADIKLDTTTNGFTGTVTVNTAGTAGLDDAEIHGGSTPLGIIASGGVGTLKLTTTGADITDEGALVVTGATTIAAGGADVTLNHGSSDLGGAVGASGRNISLTHPTTIDLGDSTVTGTYTVTATTENITDSGNLAITGLTTLVTSADGADITLDGTGHTFTGNVKVTTNETGTDEDAHATIDGGSSAGLKIERGSEVQGDLTLRSGHANTITDEGDSGVVTVDGNLTATTYANNGSITLNDLAIDGTIGLNTHGTGNATVVNDNGLQFASSTVGGDLHATATIGNITQNSEALAITGTTTLVTAASNASITLGTTSNAFTGALIITTRDDDADGTDGDVTIHGGTTALVLGTSTIEGDLALTSTATGDDKITNTGTLNIRGTTTVSAIGVNVELDSAANNFEGAVSINGVDVTVVDTNDIVFAASTITGAFTLTVGGGVTDSGTLTIEDETNISASSGNVVLNEGTNDFQKAVKIVGVNVTLVDTNAIDLGTSTVGGDYAVTAGGDITDSGVLNITGQSTFTAAGGQSILLDQSSTFTGVVTFASGGTLAGVSITDSTDFDLQALTLSGNLEVESGGSITQSGNLTIEGTSSLTTSTTDKTIALNTHSNAFTGAFTLSSTGSSAHVTIDNGTTAIVVASASVGGNLTLTSGHVSGITDSGTVTVGGNLVATTDANNGVINMGTLAVTGSIALTTDGTGNATVVNASGLDFAASTIGGDLTATATTGNITDSGALTVTGATNIYLGTNPILSVAGATSATDIWGLMITLDHANNLFTGGITLHYENVLPPDNADIDLVRQVVFAELLWGLYDNTKNIYGAYEDINDHDILRMYELFMGTLPKSIKKLKEIKKLLPNHSTIKKIKTKIIQEDRVNKEL